MRVSAVPILLVLGPLAANAQFFNAIRNLFAPVTNLFNGGRVVDDGTAAPQATGREELFPSDCGRDPNQGTGKLCFPDGLLCKESEYCFLLFSGDQGFHHMSPPHRRADPGAVCSDLGSGHEWS